MILSRLFGRGRAENSNLVDIDQSIIQPIIDSIDYLSDVQTRQETKDYCLGIVRDHISTQGLTIDQVNSCRRLSAVVALLRDLGTDKDLDDTAFDFKSRVLDSRVAAAGFRMAPGRGS